MPKLKTNKSAAKRFRTTKNGKLKRGKAFGQKSMTGKSPKRKRRLRKSTFASKSDERRINALLPYGS